MKGRSTLDVFDFGLLFQALAQSLKVGTLRVRSGGREKFIYLNRGKVEAIYTLRANKDMVSLVDRNRATNYTKFERVRVFDASGSVVPYAGGSVFLRPDSGTSKDVMVQAHNPNTNMNSGTMAYYLIWANSGSQNSYGFMQFDLTSIPEDAEITDANLSLWLYGYSSGQQLGVHEVLDGWDDDTLTWNNMPPIAGTPSDVQSVTTVGWQITGKTVQTVHGEVMKFVSFEDQTGIYETVLFPKVYHQCCHMLNATRPYVLKGKVEEAFGAITLTVHWIDFLDRSNRGNPLLQRSKRR